MESKLSRKKSKFMAKSKRSRITKFQTLIEIQTSNYQTSITSMRTQFFYSVVWKLDKLSKWPVNSV